MKKDPTGEIRQYAQSVIDYAKDLETYGFENMEKATVQNEKYWKAVVTLTAKDITALLTRLLLLMREGELKRARILLLYCLYYKNENWERDTRILV
ncbi:MAG: hypothetical protein AMS17_07275 [Spirochaetes bacterium DG_61]|nr:MAG: hypothetical protein AMS17_07275 [Spirochaetes bacterium DG_61]